VRISIHSDNTLPLDVAAFCRVLTSVCANIEFVPGGVPLRFETSLISVPESYNRLPAAFRSATQRDDHVMIATAIPYDNNFFFDEYGKYVIISFSGWNLLTNLPITNGLAYFIVSILCGPENEDDAHASNTGCINDFWWDKRGVDVGMRAAFLCAHCISAGIVDEATLASVRALLDLVATASRSHADILSFAATAAVAASISKPTTFDVFMCHNSQDKQSVRKINQLLQAAGINTWLDEDRIDPGELWQVALEEQIDHVRAACVFVGCSGIGPWQNAEIRAFLSAFIERGCRIIPTILPEATDIPRLPVFLRQMMWLDLRRDYETSTGKLIAVLKPERGLTALTS
jgi:hypothetical protein